MAGKKRRRPRGAGKTTYNAALTAEQKATIWALAEEGASQREIARQLGLSPSLVSRTLSSDPIALEALRARIAEERSKRWRQLETKGLDETFAWLEEAEKFRKKRKFSETDALRFDRIPRYMTAVRSIAEAATRQAQLLTGGATDRLETKPVEDLATAEQLIQSAIELDAIDVLPPSLQPIARRRVEES